MTRATDRFRTLKKKPEYMANIGRRCIITESSHAGLSGKECTIVDVRGNDFDGYRYEIKLDAPLYQFSTKLDYYPPVFLCEVL